ncbi:MAG: DUF4872 domain-containing protein [Bdellovibrionales bacterium]
MQITGFRAFGGEHAESATIKNLLAFAGVENPNTGQPLSEPLCFGIAGGIGAGYSFCPSMIHHGFGSGIHIVGRHKSYATSAIWYEGFFQRVGISPRILETTSKSRAFQNLLEELKENRPVVVWCSRPALPYLGNSLDACDLQMYTFIVFGLDEEKNLAHGSDRAPTPVTLSLEVLATARNGVCSHRNRTLTIGPGQTISKEKLKQGIEDGIKACADHLLHGKMKTYSLPGLEIWAKMIANNKNKDGWLKVYPGPLLFSALRDVFLSIENTGVRGGLLRPIYADFLDEAAQITGRKPLSDLAEDYRNLANLWTALAEHALPSKIKSFKQTKDLLRKKLKLFTEKGEKGHQGIEDASAKLRQLEVEINLKMPLQGQEADQLLQELRQEILVLHAAEVQTAQKLLRALE